MVSEASEKPKHPRRVAPIRPDIDPADARPLIRVSALLHADIAAATAALEADPELYQRDGQLVRVTQEDGEAPVIRPHTVPTLRARLSMFAHFQRWDPSKRVSEDGPPGAYVDCMPPDAIVKAIIDSGEWSALRVLAGILENPSLRADGSAIERPGYDAATKCLYRPSAEFGTVPGAPTQQECSEALQYLWINLCGDAPYRGLGYPEPSWRETDPDGVFRFLAARRCPDAWGVISAIMTVCGRPAIDGDVPGHIYDASTPGAGKGMQMDLVGIVCTGRLPSKLTWPGGHDETDAEVAKMLGGEVLAGSSIVAFDEITGAFGGPAINNVLTCGGRAKIRVLGKSDTPERRWRAVVLGAGNNISCRDNTHRRILMPRLEPPAENPQDRTGWRHKRLRRWARDHRTELVRAALTILRGYLAAGRPEVALDLRDGSTPTPVAEWGGGYEEWSEIVPRAIVWAGGGDVLGCRPTSDPEARNEERELVGAVVEAIAKLEPRNENGRASGAGMTAGGLIDLLYTADRLKGNAPPDGHDEAREAIDALTGTPSGKKPSAKRLGDRLRVWKRRPIGVVCLDVAAKKDRSGVARWTVRGPAPVAAAAE